jgi:hypothetical protein
VLGTHVVFAAIHATRAASYTEVDCALLLSRNEAASVGSTDAPSA